MYFDFHPNLFMANTHPTVRSPSHTTATSWGERRLSCTSFKTTEVSQAHIFLNCYSCCVTGQCNTRRISLSVVSACMSSQASRLASVAVIGRGRRERITPLSPREDCQFCTFGLPATDNCDIVVYMSTWLTSDGSWTKYRYQKKHNSF